MAKFKVGDRVRVLVDTADAKKGQTGTVREESSNPWIHFDKETKYDDPVTSLNIPAGYADCPWEGYLELITEPVVDPIDNSERDELAKQFMLKSHASWCDVEFENYDEYVRRIFLLADAYMAEKARRNNG